MYYPPFSQQSNTEFSEEKVPVASIPKIDCYTL